MLRQIFRQQMRLLRQRARFPRIAFLQCGTRTVHVVADLFHRLLLSRVQSASRQPFQLVVGSAQPPFRVLALAGGFRGSDAGRDLRRGLARSAFTNHNLSRSTRRWRGALAMFSGSARRTTARLFFHRALRRFLLRRRCLRIGGRRRCGLCRRLLRGRALCRSVLFCSGRSRSLSSGIRGACRVLAPGGHSRSRETQAKRHRESAGKSHNSDKRLFPTLRKNARVLARSSLEQCQGRPQRSA